MAKELISHFSEEELKDDRQDRLHYRNYIKSKAYLEGIDCFDAPLFHISRREAESMDPQQRFLLECAWESLENAGCDPEQYPGLIGVFVSSSISTYFIKNLLPHLLYSRANTQNESLMILGCEKDFLATKISHKLNLKGPSVVIQTACSSSLVCVHQACQSLLNYECDMALAGGISITTPEKHGYFYTPEGINAPDGHCRPFDEKASGTVIGNGGGLVVLKRLEDAIKDKDFIRGILRGTAVNNDGSEKIGYTAPSVQGQASVIESALAAADIEPNSISYIEAHGTGTPLGDPIEIDALKKAFRSSPREKKSCAIGSLKGNIGHLDAAAGIAGLIKTILCLSKKIIPQSGNFEKLNSHIDLNDSSFYISSSTQSWQAEPRIAGVSSFGIGGTNAHVIVEEYFPTEHGSFDHLDSQYFLFPFSAHTPKALEKLFSLYKSFLKDSEVSLAEMSFTMQLGRKGLSERKSLLAKTQKELLEKIEQASSSSPEQQSEYVWDISALTSFFIDPTLAPTSYRHLFEKKSLMLPDCSHEDQRFFAWYTILSQAIELGALPQKIQARTYEDYLLSLALTKALSLETAFKIKKSSLKELPILKNSTIKITDCEGKKIPLNPVLSAKDPRFQTTLADLPSPIPSKVDHVFLKLLQEAWERGVNINWNGLYRDFRPGKIPLPSYPFEKHSYWIDPPAQPLEPRASGTEKSQPGFGSLEAAIQSFWEKSLKVSPIKKTSNFFELGGDSLIALEISDAIRETLQIDFPMRKIFEAPLLSEQIDLIYELLLENLPNMTEEDSKKILEYIN